MLDNELLEVDEEEEKQEEDDETEKEEDEERDEEDDEEEADKSISKATTRMVLGISGTKARGLLLGALRIIRLKHASAWVRI